jgi:hypothetical protein
MEVEKKAKMINHTAWSGPSAPPYPSASQLYNPTFQPTPAFFYNPYPNSWPTQPPTYSKPPSLPSSQQQAQEDLPPPPPGQPPKQEPQSSQTTQPAALPTFGMIMPTSGGSTLEFQNKRQCTDYFRQVNSILVDGPTKKTPWPHMPITFS